RPHHGNVENWRQRDRHRCRAHLSATSTVATNPASPAACAAISVRILAGISIMTRRDWPAPPRRSGGRAASAPGGRGDGVTGLRARTTLYALPETKTLRPR